MDDLPKNDHVTRYCPNTQIHEDGSIDPAAFSLRMLNGKVEEYLSLNWIEYHGSDRSLALEEIGKIVKRIRAYTDESVLAILNVGNCIDNVKNFSDDGRELKIRHVANKANVKSFKRNPSHSGVFNLKIDDDIVLELIAESISEKHNNT